MTPPELPLCPNCQAPHAPDEAFCWMCHHRFWDGAAPAPTPAAPAPQAPPPPSAPRPKAEPAAPPLSVSGDGWTQPILIGAFLFIMAGVAAGSGTGTAMLWLGLIPALFVTALAGLRKDKKEPVTFVEKLVWLATKLASVVAILILSLAALCIALMAVCFAVIAVSK